MWRAPLPQKQGLSDCDLAHIPGVSEKVRVVLAVPSTLMRDALRSLLESQGGFEVPAVASAVDDVLDAATRLRPDVLLLESGGAWGVGLDILAEVESIVPEVKTLLLAAAAAPPPLAEAIIVGARGVVFHDASPQLLFRAIRTVAAGQYWVGRENVVSLLRHVRERAASPAASHPADRLTARERQIVAGIAAGESNRDLATRLGLSEGTIKYYVTAVYDKLGVSNRAELTALAISRGIRIARDEPDPTPDASPVH